MQKLSLINIVKFITNPNRFRILLKKVNNRFFDKTGDSKVYLKWMEENYIDFKDYAKNLDLNLWNEAVKFSEDMEQDAKEKLSHLDFKLGGGGIYPLLYFLVRKLKPNNIVETGVAAGFSSQAFLKALDKNGKGKLFSSDFPYFRIKDGEKFIGIVVDESLMENWTLYIDGDSVNIPKILEQVSTIDIFHYDSDKAYSSRDKIIRMVLPKMNKEGIILVDDIHNNSQFMDYINTNKIESWRVFKFQGKYIGMIGDIY
tara:strand:- start:2261 stop:3031 length:771 start_codon:yes stop_codon:yes gene_type:complete